MPEYRLRINTILRGSNKAPIWRDLTFPFSRRKILDHFSQMTFDVYSRMYFTATDVQVWSVTGQYVDQLPQLSGTMRYAHGLAADIQRHVLYVGQSKEL